MHLPDKEKLIIANIIKYFPMYSNKTTKLFGEVLRYKNEESIHDLRVSVRRLLSFAILLNKLYPSEYHAQLNKILKPKMKRLNPLRDTQVQIERFKKLLPGNINLLEFYNYLLLKEREFKALNMIYLSEKKIEILEGVLFFYFLDVKSKITDNDKNLAKIIANAENVYDVLVEKVDLMDTSNLDSIHKLRLAFKNFRYTIESSAKLLGVESVLINKLKQFQNLLGAIQDNNVIESKLMKFYNETKLINRKDFEVFEKNLLDQRKRLIKTLCKRLPVLEKYNPKSLLES